MNRPCGLMCVIRKWPEAFDRSRICFPHTRTTRSTLRAAHEKRSEIRKSLHAVRLLKCSCTRTLFFFFFTFRIRRGKHARLCKLCFCLFFHASLPANMCVRVWPSLRRVFVVTRICLIGFDTQSIKRKFMKRKSGRASQTNASDNQKQRKTTHALIRSFVPHTLSYFFVQISRFTTWTIFLFSVSPLRTPLPCLSLSVYHV